VSGFHTGDMALIGRSLVDDVVTPRRASLIPGAAAAMEAALSAGALGSSLSGSGPSVFALCRSARSAEVAAKAMQRRFFEAGLESDLRVSPADGPGVRRWRGE
jgi:homoserine kinase